MDMILKNTFQSISPAYELIGDVTVASNTTQVDFTGLNIGKDDELLLVTTSINPDPVQGSYTRLFFNDNLIASNYYVQNLRAYTTTIAGSKVNAPDGIYTEYSRRSSAFTKIKLTNSGYIVYQSESTIMDGSLPPQPQIWDMHGTSTFTATTITKISLINTISNNIAAGSRFQLYKLVAEKVADIIVPSNTTSVDITGLSIGKGNEYYLVSDVVSGVNSDYYLYVNDNTTATNYYSQRLTANSTTVNGARTNNPNILDASSGNKSLIMSNIKLTNSGYLVSQNNSCENYGGSGIILNKYYTTPTFTADPITKLTITASATNGIATDSRFTLYKMK